ncbi:MAG: FkbM family methyltransferase, partial [Planctomycetota bacterium]
MLKSLRRALTTVHLALRWMPLVRNPWVPALEFAGWLKGPYVDYHLWNGLRLQLHARTLDCHILREIYSTRPYIEPSREELAGRDEYVVVDCGANLGLYTTKVAKLDPQKIRVYSYEPHPETFELLRGNVERNGLANVSAFRKAVGGACGRRRLWLSEDSACMHSVAEVKEESIEVEMITLEEAFRVNGLEQVDHLKMDIEGAEYEALL